MFLAQTVDPDSIRFLAGLLNTVPGWLIIAAFLVLITYNFSRIMFGTYSERQTTKVLTQHNSSLTSQLDRLVQAIDSLASKIEKLGAGK